MKFEKGGRELWEEIWMFQTAEGGSGSWNDAEARSEKSKVSDESTKKGQGSSMDAFGVGWEDVMSGHVSKA